MRIISGYAKGHTLAKPKHKGVRPTTDRVRESLFSILGNIEDFNIIDGFAGTGALGCEAISRGAANAYFFDNSKASIALVRQNVERIHATEKAIIRPLRFDHGIKHVHHNIDLIFLDPPYHTHWLQKAINALDLHPALHEDTLIVMEQEADEPLPTFNPEHFELTDQRNYGRTRIAFLRCLIAQDVVSEES